MSLQFFGKRIGVNVDRLNWAIVQTQNSDGERKSFPAISIKGAALYYDFLKDEMDFIVNTGGCQTLVEKAQMTETKEGYRFEVGQKVIEFSSEKVNEFYEDKVYSEELNHQAQRFA